MIYFIAQSNKAFVKIGYTSKPIKKRLGALQTGNPFRLVVLDIITGNKRVEKAIHKKFDKYRFNGEWFRYSREIRDFIRDVNPTMINKMLDGAGMESNSQYLQMAEDLGALEYVVKSHTLPNEVAEKANEILSQ